MTNSTMSADIAVQPTGCLHDLDELDARPGLTRTGHVIGGVYFRGDHNMHYVVLATATKWQHAPEDAVALLWQNGKRTVTSRRRGRDPMCRTYPLGESGSDDTVSV